MKNQKKLLIAFILIFLFLASIPLSVSANAPPPADHLTVELFGLPEDAAYADLLIKIDEADKNYIPFQPNAFAKEPYDVWELAEYADDGYCSFTFHYKNAKSNIALEEYYDNQYRVVFCDDSAYQGYMTQYEDLLQNYSDIKIAVLDRDYRILAVSDVVRLPDQNQLHVFTGHVVYDVAAGTITADEYVNFYYFIFAFLISAVLILLSVGTEVIVALMFRLRGNRLLTVLLVNACTQITMRVLYVVLPFPYLVETIALEAAVYLAEFLIYQRHMKQMRKGRILCYTIVANTLSLILGIAFDRLLFV